jgi:hypothetical protein
MLKPLTLAMLLCGVVSAQAADKPVNLSVPCGVTQCGLVFGQVDWDKPNDLYGFTLNGTWLALDHMGQWQDRCTISDKRVAAGGKALKEIVGNKPVLCLTHDQFGHTGGRFGTCYLQGAFGSHVEIAVEMHKKGF